MYIYMYSIYCCNRYEEFSFNPKADEHFIIFLNKLLMSFIRILELIMIF